MAKKRSRAELEVDNERLRISRLADIIVPIINNTIKWGALIALFYFSHLSIADIAGKDTNTDIKINVLQNLFNLNFFSQSHIVVALVAIIIILCGIIYGQRQRNLRMTTIERLQARINTLEKNADPNRSSSMLTTKGDTRPEDH